jgi:hypothetical protein
MGLSPSAESGQGFIEGTGEIGELVEGGGLYPARVDVARHQPVSLGAAQRGSKNFVRHPV